MQRRHWIPTSPILPALCFISVSVVSPRSVLGQRPYDAADGFLVLEAVPREVAHTTCLTDLRMGSVVPPQVLSCGVTEVVTMDTTDTRWWTMVRYRREAVERFHDDVDTLALDEVVLFAEDPNRGLAIPVWHTIRDRDFEFIQDFRWARKRSGLLIAIDLCLNGTGGCHEQLLITHGGDHLAVVKQTYLTELAQRAPKGFRLHKGRMLDLETLDGEQPLAAENDANCCPSGLMRFSAWLDGRHLRLVTAELVRPEPSRAGQREDD